MLTVESSVVAVTVYRTGALVTREAIVPRGGDGYPQHVQLVGLPLTLDDGSIRVEVDAESAAAPVAGDVRVTVAVPDADDRLPPPDDEELEQARLQQTTAARALKDLRAALQRLSLLTVGERGAPEEGRAPARSPTAARMHLLELRRHRESVLHERIADAHEHAQDAKQHLDALLERRRVASDGRNTRTFELRKAAVVRLEGGDASAEQARVRLRYFVTGARWAPAYTVRLNGDMQDGSLQVRALVGQRTGEDWRNVALTLSTARPQHWTDLPEIKAVRIGRAQPEPRKVGWRPAPVGAEALYADYDHGLPRPLPPPAKPIPPAETAAAADDYERDSITEPPAAAPSSARRRESAPKKRTAPPPTAAPPPPMAAAPAPQGVAQHRVAEAPGAALVPQAMARSAASKGAGIGNLVGGVLGGAAAGLSAVFSAGEEQDDEGYGGGGAEDGPRQLVAGRDLLDYGALQLRRADHPHRGRLQRVQTRVLYERWAAQEVTTDIIVQCMSAAVGSARTLEHAAPPPGYNWIEDDSGFDYAYVSDAPVDVHSDGKMTSLAVTSHPIAPTPRYISVPRESQEVFRVVAVRSPVDAPLLPGPVDVYVAGKFVLTSTMDLTVPRGRFELGLGVEQAIKIARNIDFQEDTSGLIKRSHELVHTIRVEIANNLPGAAVVEIRERVPVKTEGDDDLEVEIGEVNPAWEEYEQREPWPIEGGRVWKVEVAAASKRTLTATWLARIPSQHELVGGNRRES